LSLAAIGWLTLRPAHASASPLDSHLCLICGELAGVDIVLNVLLFVPLGVGLNLCGLSFWKAVLLCGALSLSIETTQAFVVPGRDSTLSDVLTNTFGGAIGFWLSRTAPTWLAPSRKRAAWLAAVWSAIWLLIQIASSYTFSLSLPRSQYYGQLARALGGMAGFHGEVARATIGGLQIPDDEFADSHLVRQLLVSGAPIAGVVRLTEPTRYFAPIIRLADEKQREITAISENAEMLVFSIRTGAANLRLRQPGYGLREVFPAPTPPADSSLKTFMVTASYSNGAVQIAAQTPSGLRELNVSPRAALAWSAMLPFQWYLEDGGIDRGITFLWTSLLMIPFGYWLAILARNLDPLRDFVLLSLFAAMLATGFILVPARFALRGASVLDWIAALIGLGIGSALTVLLSDNRKPASI
jgi:VanZ family protein